MWFALLCCLLASAPALALAADAPGTASTIVPAGVDPVSLVDPFIGTSGVSKENAVDDFPGADMPFGMLEWSPDTPSNVPGGGYGYDDTAITGFSLTHLSGAGCGVFGDFRFMPTVGAVVDPANAQAPFSHADERAHPGSYAVTFARPAITTELTVTPRTGLGAFTFPAGAVGNILINTSSDQAGVSDASFHRVNAHEVSGSATSGALCGMPDVFTVYFDAQFDRDFVATGTWNQNRVSPGAGDVTGPQTGGYVRFDTSTNRTVNVKVSVSWVSVAGARANIAAEGTSWNLADVRAAAAAAWRGALGHIAIGGATLTQARIFETALYHAFLHPNIFSDADGTYRGFDDAIHHTRPGHVQYANFSDWDTYRTQTPLIALLVPHETSDMIQSLVNDANEGGWLPRWPLANTYTGVMAGDSVDPLIAGAYAFGARDFDRATALAAMVKGASVVPQTLAQGFYIERPGLDEYLQRGYVVNVHTTSVSPVPNGASETLEYALDDFAIAQFARAAGGDVRTQTEFMRRSQNWTKLFDREDGLILPRDADGAFIHSPIGPNGQSGFQEGNAWQYTWMIPQNLGGLVDALGGRGPTIARLDRFFRYVNAGQTQPYAWLGNAWCDGHCSTSTPIRPLASPATTISAR
jgi:predicted alpha-1,2-mannosidase